MGGGENKQTNHVTIADLLMLSLIMPLASITKRHFMVRAGCRERHPADGRSVAGREADQDQLGYKETFP